jgi:hypothetical protein
MYQQYGPCRIRPAQRHCGDRRDQPHSRTCATAERQITGVVNEYAAPNGWAAASCRALITRSGCPETVCRLQSLGSCDVGVAGVECKKLFVVPVAASPCYVLPVDLHLPHVSPLVSRFDPLPLSIAFRTLGVVEASSHLQFRAAGAARYLLAGSALIGDA